MIVEERIYTLHPGQVGEYMRLYENEGFPIQEPVLGRLAVWDSTDFGPLNRIIHMWAYDSHAERDRRRAELAEREDWQAFLGKIRPLIKTQENKTLVPAPWSPVR